MQPIANLEQCPAAFAPLAAKINELVDRVNLLSSLEAGPGLRLVESDAKLILEIGALTGELVCNESGPGGTIEITGS